MELRHLRYLLAVVDHGGFGRAARALNVSQPPLSRQVRELEEEIGARLLDRDHRGVRLTEAGEVFLNGAKTLLADLDGLSARTRSIGQGQAGRLRIGYSQSAADLMIDAVARFRDVHPRVEIELVELTAAQQRDALDRDAFDLTLGYLLPPLQADHIRAFELFTDPVRFAVPASLHRGDRFTLSRLSTIPLLFLPRRAAPRLHAEALVALERVGVRPPEVHGIASVRTVLTLVGGGAGFGLIPSSIARRGARGVRFLTRKLPGVHLTTYAFLRRERPAAMRMLEVLRAVA